MGCTVTIHTQTANPGISDLPEQSCSLAKASIAVDDLTMICDFEGLQEGCLPIGSAHSTYAAEEFGMLNLRWGAARAIGERTVGLSARPSFPVMNGTTHDLGDVITRVSGGGNAL
jgi:hypothetical protein